MKTIRFFRLLVLRIVIITAFIIAWSYLTDYIQENSNFFEDVWEKEYSYSDFDWAWGWRHYIWSGLGTTLFTVSIIRIFVWGDWYWTQIKKDDDVDLKSPENKLF